MENRKLYNFYLNNRFVVYVKLNQAEMIPTGDRLIDSIYIDDMRNLGNLVNILQNSVDATLLELNHSAEILKQTSIKNKIN